VRGVSFPASAIVQEGDRMTVNQASSRFAPCGERAAFLAGPCDSRVREAFQNHDFGCSVSRTGCPLCGGGDDGSICL